MLSLANWRPGSVSFLIWSITRLTTAKRNTYSSILHTRAVSVSVKTKQILVERTVSFHVFLHRFTYYIYLYMKFPTVSQLYFILTLIFTSRCTIYIYMKYTAKYNLIKRNDVCGLCVEIAGTCSIIKFCAKFHDISWKINAREIPSKWLNGKHGKYSRSRYSNAWYEMSFDRRTDDTT